MKKSILYSGIVLAMFSTMSMAVDSSSVPSSQEELNAHQKQMADRLSAARQSASADSAPCKNEQGQSIECPKPELGRFDVCPNLDGDQNRLPPGRIMKDGDCILVNLENDVCSNIADVQAYTPLGMVNNAGICETPIAPPPIDVCPNIPGDQAIVPNGMEIKNGDCVSSVPLAVDLCTNLDGDQAVIPMGYTRDAVTETCTMIESCVPWYNLKNEVVKHGPGLYRSAKGDLYLIALQDAYKFMPYMTRYWIPQDSRDAQQKAFETSLSAPWGLSWYAVLGDFTSKDVKQVRKDCDPLEDTKEYCLKNPYSNTPIMDMYIKDRKVYNEHISMNAPFAGPDQWFGHTVAWVIDQYTAKNYPDFYNKNPNYIYRRGSNHNSPYEIVSINSAISRGYNRNQTIAYSDGILTDDFWDFDNNFFSGDGIIFTHDWNKAIMTDCDTSISNGKTTELSDVIEKVMYVKSLTTTNAGTQVGSGVYNLDVMSRSKAKLKPLN